MPMHLLEVPEAHAPLESYNLTTVNNSSGGVSYPLYTPGHWPSGDYFGDGSEGVDTAMPVLRRCGVAICLYGRTGPIQTAYSPLPGDEQTVYRAELLAVIFAVELVEEEGTVNYFIDNQAVCDTYHKGYDRALLSQAADLFHRLFAVIRLRKVTLTLSWMPSHLKDPAKRKKVTVPSFVTDWHIDANDYIDNVANQAAALHAVPPSVAQPILKRANDLKLVQLRCADIIKSLPSRGGRTPAPLKQKRCLEGSISTSRHVISMSTDGKAIICHKCHSCISLNARHLFDFLEGSCNIPMKDFPVIALGKKHSHPSHHLVLYGGVYICTACAYVAKEKIHKLSEPCLGRPGARNNRLSAFDKGLPLPGYSDWPYRKQSMPFLFRSSCSRLSVSEATAFHRVVGQVQKLRSKGLAELSSSGDSSSD